MEIGELRAAAAFVHARLPDFRHPHPGAAGVQFGSVRYEACVRRIVMENQPLRRVPWTCTWGRFGGPIDAARAPAPGFVFWVCGHPDTNGAGLLDRSTCETCPRWETARVLETAVSA